MTRFEKFIPIIFKNEGCLSDVKGDPGGLTKYGISQRAYPHLDIKNLTLQQAQQIYKRDYYDICKIDMITDENLALQVFDFAVNAGNVRSISTLQVCAGVVADGLIGTKTLNAVNSADLLQKFIGHRVAFYKKIAVGHNEKFLKGWINRVNNTKI